jgi:hypothetical protein
LSQSGKVPKPLIDIENYNNSLGNNETSHHSSNSKNNQITNKINQITARQKRYIKRILIDILNNSSENAKNICNFIIVERNEINIKE